MKLLINRSNGHVILCPGPVPDIEEGSPNILREASAEDLALIGSAGKSGVRLIAQPDDAQDHEGGWHLETFTPEPEPPDLLSALNDKFAAVLAPEEQVAFAAPYATVRVLIQAGQPAMARAVIEQTPVPAALAEAKAALLALFAA